MPKPFMRNRSPGCVPGLMDSSFTPVNVGTLHQRQQSNRYNCVKWLVTVQQNRQSTPAFGVEAS